MVALLAYAGVGAAQTDEERAGARAAAEQGQKAFDAGRYAEAADMFTKAEQLVHAPPHLVYLARSYEKLGRLVRAREAYLKLKRVELAANAPAAFKAAKEAAEAELPGIEARLGRVTIQLEGSSGAEVSVTMDGAPISSALVGVPTPVDPGQRTFAASAPGFTSAPVSVTVAEGGQETVVLRLTRSAAPPPGDPPPDTVSVSTADSGLRPMQIGGFAALGVGVLGLGAGTFFLLSKSSAESDADDKFVACRPNCSPAQQNEILGLDDDAKSAGTLSTVGFIVGGVGVAAGVTLLVLDANRKPSTGAFVQPWVGLGSAGVLGRF